MTRLTRLIEFAILFATFEEHVRSTSSVRQVVPPDSSPMAGLRGTEAGPPEVRVSGSEVTGFQTGSGQTGLSQKGHKSPTFGHVFKCARCHILSHSPRIRKTAPPDPGPVFGQNVSGPGREIAESWFVQREFPSDPGFLVVRTRRLRTGGGRRKRWSDGPQPSPGE